MVIAVIGEAVHILVGFDTRDCVLFLQVLQLALIVMQRWRQLSILYAIVEQFGLA